MSTITADSDVRQVPRASLISPTALEPTTPAHELMGVTVDPTASHVQQARDLVERFPDSIVAHARLAQAEQSIGDDDAAAGSAAVALRLRDDNHAAARIAAAAIFARVNPAEASAVFGVIDDPVAKLNWATEAVAREDYQEAIVRLRGVELASAHSLRGFCLTSIGEHSAAIREFRKARRAGRSSVEVLINMGYAFSHVGSIDKAIQFTQQAVRDAPANATASYNLARYFIRAGQDDRATVVLDRLSAARPWDGQSLLYRAWSRVDTTSGTQAAVKILGGARSRFSAATEPVVRAEIDASIYYLRAQMGDMKGVDALSRVGHLVDEIGRKSSRVISMYVELLSEAKDSQRLEKVLDEFGDVLNEPELHLARSKLALLLGDVHLATSEAIAASRADESNDYGTASAVAYLVGEVEGQYARGAELAGAPFGLLPNVYTGNNLAFCLALSGRPKEALRVLGQFSTEELPFFGATLGLAYLSDGRLADGLRRYQEAEDEMRASGNAEMADCIAVRAGLALRQLEIEHPRASEDAILARWRFDSKDPRWTVLACVAARVGIELPPK